MKFNIVEGSDPFDKMSDFVELYNQDFTVSDICNRLCLSNGEYRLLRNHARKDGLLEQKSKGARFNVRKKRERFWGTHIHKHDRGFSIRRGGVYFCYVKDYRVALRIVECLEECGWDKSKVKSIRDFVVENY